MRLDPYSVQEQQEFTKCDHECPDEKHHKSQGSSAPPPTKSFCELPLFHSPLNPNSNPPNNYGYISLNEHHLIAKIQVHVKLLFISFLRWIVRDL